MCVSGCRTRFNLCVGNCPRVRSRTLVRDSKLTVPVFVVVTNKRLGSTESPVAVLSSQEMDMK